MAILRGFSTGQTARKPPPAPRRGRASALTRTLLIGLALVTVASTGCQSLRSLNPFRNHCGGGLFNRGLFNRDRVIVYEGEPVLEDPGAVEILPGDSVETVPALPPATERPLYADPEYSPPLDLEPPSTLELEPEPSERREESGSSDSSRRERSGSERTGRSSDEDNDEDAARSAFRPLGGSDDGRSVAESSGTAARRPVEPKADIRPAPTFGSGGLGADPASALAPDGRPLLDDSGLDDVIGALPEPVDPVVPEPPDSGADVPTPPISPEPGPPVDEPLPVPPSVEPDPEPPSANPPPPPDDSARLETRNQSIPGSPPPSGGAPGIASLNVVEPHLAGGSYPSPEGWAYLADKGYHTLLDLRPAAQIQPADIATIHNAGFRHVTMPMTPGAIDDQLLRRFKEEIGDRSARPIYFCDRDGSGAAVLWFAHRVAHDGLDPTLARREAEAIGPLTEPWMKAARAFLGLPDADAHRRATEEAQDTEEPKLAAGPEAAPAPPAPQAASPTSRESSPEEPVRDPTGWMTATALPAVLSIFLLTLWGGGGFLEGIKAKVRASLPGPGRAPRSLPRASDADN